MESRQLLLEQLRSFGALIDGLDSRPLAEHHLHERQLTHLAECAATLVTQAGIRDGSVGVHQALEAWLEAAAEEDLDREAFPQAEGTPTAGASWRATLSGHVGHLAWHLGQVAARRAAAGLPAMPGWPSPEEG